MLRHTIQMQQGQIHQLLELGNALTTEKDFEILLEKILATARRLTNADAGTLYMVDDECQKLLFKVVRTQSLGVHMGGSGSRITWGPIDLFHDNGEPNHEMVAAVCALSGEPFMFKDVYSVEGFDFEGTKEFDLKTGYRTQSMLVIPMKNHMNDVIGVLQLINKQDEHGEVIPFTEDDRSVVSSIASQTAIILTNNQLILDFEKLLDSFIRSIATAIDEKSRYTGGHISRVAELALMMVDAINSDPSYFHKSYGEDAKKEIMYAAWMHDIGKITTPEYVIDKETKLQTMYDRIGNVKLKFELLKGQLALQCERGKMTAAQLSSMVRELDDDFAFLEEINHGYERVAQESLERVKAIGQRRVELFGKDAPLLDDDEIENLTIVKGTLTEKEREIINKHASVSLKMLKKLHFPKKWKRIPEIAGGHHEKVCGGGYPLNLHGEEINFEARLLAIADIFEALTASDRPYNQINTLNQAMAILHDMTKNGDLDKEIIKFFVDNNLHVMYAQNNCDREQLDEVTVSFDDL